MAQRVFFHVGAPKTGTTFLQTVVWHNRDELRRHGLLYPGHSHRDHLHASQVVRGRQRALGRPDHADSWDRIVGELAEWPADGLISHEFFGMASSAQARRALARLAPAEVHVIVTARDYARQFAADWQESLKMNCDLSLDEFVEQGLRHELPRPWGWNSHDVVATLERWGGSLPRDRVHVITVPRSGAPRDLLWRRWCAVLGLDPDAYDLDVAFANESLGAAQAALLQRVKPRLSGPLVEGPEKHRWVRAYFAHDVLLAQGGERFSLRAHHFARLQQAAEEAVSEIEKAGYDVEGDLTELVPEPDTQSRPYPDDLDDSELLAVATTAIERMIRDVRALTLERNRWRRRAQRRNPLSRVRRRLAR